MEQKWRGNRHFDFQTLQGTRMHTYKNLGDYLFVESDEPYSLPMFFITIHEVAERCGRENLQKALVDISKMTGDPSIIDRYETGVEIAKYWGKKIQVAAIAREGIINYLAETVALNRGAHFKVFWNMPEALKWLGVDDPSPD